MAILTQVSHRLTKKIIEWKPIALRPKGRPKMKWEGDVKHNLKVTEIYHWKKHATNRNEWEQIIEQARTHDEFYH
jgi:hypothetical protein